MKRILLLVLCSVVCISGYSQINANLMACYPFDGNANDMSGNLHHGIVNGATLTSDRFGNPSSVYQFDGVNDYINIGLYN